MNNVMSWLLAAGLLLSVSGCVHGTDHQMFVDPSVSPDTRYDGFLAYGAFKDLAVEGRFEKAFCQALTAARHACTPMLSAAPPTQPQDGASRQRAVAESGAQATLVIELLDPDSASRRLLADGRPGFRVSVIDTASQQVVARIAIDPSSQADDLKTRAEAVASAAVAALRAQRLLEPR